MLSSRPSRRLEHFKEQSGEREGGYEAHRDANSETRRCRLPLPRGRLFAENFTAPAGAERRLEGGREVYRRPLPPHPEAKQRSHAPAAPIPRRARAPRPAGTAPTSARGGPRSAEPPAWAGVQASARLGPPGPSRAESAPTHIPGR